jgi:hypothetical protein
MLRSRWFAPALHVILFAATWALALGQPKPLLDGPARWSFLPLFFADLPISLFGFSAMWDGKWTYGIWLWAILGTIWWYFLGRWIQNIYVSLSTSN